MSQENVELARRGYELMMRGRLEAVLSVLDPEVELKTSDVIADAATYHGHYGARQLFDMWSRDFENFTMEPVSLREGPYGQVVAEVRLRGTGRSSGFPFDHRAFHVWTARNGLAVRLAVFTDRDEALEAVGLSE